MNYVPTNQVKVAVDVQDLQSRVIYDSLLECGGQIFQTKRERKAILIGKAALSVLQRKYSLLLLEGPDGTAILKD